MKNFETTKETKHYALIRARSPESALEVYYEEVGIENAAIVNFKEVSDDYVIEQHRNLDDKHFADDEMEAVLKQAESILTNDDLVGNGLLMIIDSAVI